MYDWVSHTHTSLGGACLHACPYCYVGKFRWGRPKKYTGPIRLLESELKIKYGGGKTIFIEHMNDLFAANVPENFILKILKHLLEFPRNKYVLQSKNPERAAEYLGFFPEDVLFGTTIETNRDIEEGKAPQPSSRYEGIMAMKTRRIPRFVTIEPIMDFDPAILADWIKVIGPEFVAIGADSKGCALKEPTADKVRDLVSRIQAMKIEIRRKTNLGRLLEG
jgi:DNA repair photolyase